MTAADERRRAAARERQRRHRAGEAAPPLRRVYLEVAADSASLRGAACATEDPELWFSEIPEDQDLAKAICEGCPVRTRCHVKAERNGERFGIWAGEDRSVRRTRKAKAA